ncbi:DROUGHT HYPERSENSITIVE 2, SQUALENE EPOXIDASE 1 [Hibiscus trionum]|uniref:Squalene monooxygenase n=1 Tax=Hibiscus trionum TaxID=183268 RepID=A0A9W7J5Y3_HIBTR|nr:DROUGHT HYPERSENSITIVE 2, SQUALENE EPOXIDASE 1 [Hibiscus trionum]
MLFFFDYSFHSLVVLKSTASGVIARFLGIVFFYYNSLVRAWRLNKQKKPASMEENCVNKHGNRKTVETTEIIIVGAGVAGAALAYILGKDGRRLHVIERDLNAPRRIAGENLMPGGYLKLIELGLEDCVDEIDAQRFLGYDLYKDGNGVTVSFPLVKFPSDVVGRSFHNGRFVQKLREKAASLHNVSLEQGTVTSLIEDNGTVKGVHYKDKSGRLLTAHAPLTVVCDGCFSNLRRSLCNPNVDVPSYFVGLGLTDCKLPKENYGAVILADPSPILLYTLSSTEVRCMVDIPSRNLPSVSDGEMAHYLRTMVAPKVLPELYTAFMSAIDKKNNIRVVPNKIMAAAPKPIPGAFLIGDALNIRHALTGGGMTVALSDVVLLRDLLRPLRDLSHASAVSKYLEAFYTMRKPMSSTINIAANVLQKVFRASSDPTMEDMQQAYFGYLKLGGPFSNGVSAILSGLSPRPLCLAFHFLAMSIYGVGRLLLPFPSPKRLWNGAKLLWVASSILLPFIWSEGVRQMFFPQTVPAYYRTPPGNKGIKVREGTPCGH